MLLSTMKRLPERVGDVLLSFSEEVGGPYLDEVQGIIHLSSPDEGTEFFFLDRKTKFLYSLSEIKGKDVGWSDGQFTPNYGARRAQLWFGGMDEAPFLVELDPRLLGVYKSRGAQTFFERLLPQVARFCEKAFKTRSRRQGDIYATPIRLSLSDLMKIWPLLDDNVTKPESHRMRIEVLDTRHMFQGFVLGEVYKNWDDRRLFDPDLSFGDDENFIIVADGVLEAPNHKPLKLKGAHVLSQACHLVDNSD